jgi:hypothetical protein
MSAESEEDVAKEKDKGNTVGYSVMGGENEATVRLLVEQHSAEERSLIGSERRVYLFRDLPLPPCIWRRNDAERDAPGGDTAELRDAVGSSVNAGREQRVALLYCVESVAPLLDGCVAGDLGCKRMVGGEVLVEETEQLFKGTEGTEQIAGEGFETLTFKGHRRHDAFLFHV